MARGRRRHATRRTTCRARSPSATACTPSRSTSAGASRRRRARGRPARLRRASTTTCARRASCRRTSQPSVGDFLAVYEPLLEAGDGHRLDPPLGRHLGHRARRRAGARPARRARRRARAHRASSTRRRRAPGIGLMAIAAANAAQRGADARPRPPSAPGRCAQELKILFAVDTLEFLRRGGRIGGAQAWIGSTLKIKPILAIESEIVPDRARAHLGPRVRAPGRPPRSRCARTATTVFFVQHIQARRPGGEAGRSAARRSIGRPPGVRLRDGPGDRHPRGPRAARRHRAARATCSARSDAAAGQERAPAGANRAGGWRAAPCPARRRAGHGPTLSARVVLRIVLIDRPGRRWRCT